MTITVSARVKYNPPGDYDPVVNQKLRDALQQKADDAWMKRTKDKIAMVINALQATYERMNIAGKNAWWDNKHFQQQIPDRVGNLCNVKRGKPDALDCERASFNFIRKGQTPTISPGKPLILRHGEPRARLSRLKKLMTEGRMKTDCLIRIMCI